MGKSEMPSIDVETYLRGAVSVYEPGFKDKLHPTALAMRFPETFFTIGGGAASSVADELLETSLKRSLKADGGARLPIHIFAMSHGSGSPYPLDSKGRGREELVPERVRSGSSAIGHLRELHSETSCGFSQGNSRNTEKAQIANVAKFMTTDTYQVALAKGYNIQIHLVQAMTALPKHENKPYGFGDFDLSMENLKFNLLTIGNDGKCKTPSSYAYAMDPDLYMNKKMLDLEELAGFIKSCEDEGWIGGIGCIDQRNGLVTRNSDISRIDLVQLSDLINPRIHGIRGFLHSPIRIINDTLGHNELPFAFLNVSRAARSGNVTNPVLAAARVTQGVDMALLTPSHRSISSGPGLAGLFDPALGNDPQLARAGIIFMNIPEELLAGRAAPSVIAGTEQLVSNLDRLKYRAGSGTRVFGIEDEEFCELKMPKGGLYFVVEDRVKWELAEAMKFGLPAGYSGEHFMHPNPSISSYRVGSGRFFREVAIGL